jgi:ferric-dicitrate binding protein FerR (iron transport regulator)
MTPDDDRDSIRIVRLLTGDATEQEEIEHWQRLSRDPVYAESYRSALAIWDGLHPQEQSWDVDSALSSIRERAARTSAVSPGMRSRSVLRPRRARHLIGGMACAAAVAAAALVWLHRPEKAPAPFHESLPLTPPVVAALPLTTTPSEQRAVYAAARGQQRRIQLSDGSSVLLLPGATLELRAEPTASWGRRARHVRLRGEAQFAVARDTARPFIVHAAHSHVQVLGTQFVVTTSTLRYGITDRDAVAVAVREGRVRVQHTNEQMDQRDASPPTRDLRAGDAILMTGDGAMQNITAADVLEAADGHLVFRKAPLDVVASEIRRLYNIDLVVAPNVDRDLRITARFERAPLAELFEQLAFVSGQQITANGRQYVLHP